jgi:hypothetical protein
MARLQPGSWRPGQCAQDHPGDAVRAQRQGGVVDQLLERRLCSTYRVPLLVLHDFDKSGFSILGTLQRDTRRYVFRNSIQVIDLGLRLEDVEAHELETESVHHTSDPASNLRENGATAEESKFLRTRRVELNAFASAPFIAWIERKLEQHGVAKLLPDPECLALAYRRGVASAYVRSRFDAIVEAAQDHAGEATVPDNLGALVAERMRTDHALAWDDVVRQLVLERATGRPERDPWSSAP